MSNRYINQINHIFDSLACDYSTRQCNKVLTCLSFPNLSYWSETLEIMIKKNSRLNFSVENINISQPILMLHKQISHPEKKSLKASNFIMKKYNYVKQACRTKSEHQASTKVHTRTATTSKITFVHWTFIKIQLLLQLQQVRLYWLGSTITCNQTAPRGENSNLSISIYPPFFYKTETLVYSLIWLQRCQKINCFCILMH